MIKFMRKHNKKLLAVFASGLLVVWLGSTALQEMFRPDTGEEVAGRIFGQEFTRQDLSLAHMRIDALERMGLLWNQPWGGGMYNLPIEPIDPLTWFLLDREARRSGVEIPSRAIQRFLTASRNLGRVLENLRDRKGISVERLMDFISDHMRIARLGQFAMASVKVSMPDVEHFLRDTREKITVRMSVLRASDFADPNGRPDLATLEKHFYKYRDFLPGEGKHGYGYKWPDRVRVEYLAADVDRIEEALPIARDEARDYWALHRKEYTMPDPTASAPASNPTAGPTTSKPTTTTAEAVASRPTTSSKPATKRVVKSFAQAYDDVVAEMKRRRAPNVAEKLIRQASERLLEPWYDVTPDEETGYKPAPRGVDAPGYLEKIAGEVCARNNLPKDVLRVVKPARWLTQADAAVVEGIGGAAVEGKQDDEEGAVRFSDMAFRVQGLYAPPKRDSSARGLARYEPFNTPLRDTKDGQPHNYYLFRVVAAEAEHIPKAIDEIKDKLRADVIELAGYRLAGEAANKLLAAGRAKGIEAAVKADPALAKRLGKNGVVNPEPFARRRSLGQIAMQLGLPMTIVWPLEDLGVTEDAKNRFFPVKMVAERFEPEVEKLIETCFSLAPQTDAASKPTPSVALVEMPESKQWVVVEFVKIERVLLADYVKVRQQALELLQAYRTIEFMKRWYDPESVKKRTAYVPASDEEWR